ncbi:RNA-binding protein [Alphaproteobacteria bacterium]|jgi:RNA recognition motif-containing protein|nr:RNA-binding protein [Alphaproteobacteria bacterium]MDB9971539.1 RNA-binding protein [Alphaproteobacteria bacterium]
MKIITLNLPRTLTVNELEKMFNAYGDVESCNIVTDDETGKSKGFGFIEMPVEREAEKAIEKLHGTKVLNEKIRVKRSNQN